MLTSLKEYFLLILKTNCEILKRLTGFNRGSIVEPLFFLICVNIMPQTVTSNYFYMHTIYVSCTTKRRGRKSQINSIKTLKTYSVSLVIINKSFILIKMSKLTAMNVRLPNIKQKHK